MKHAIPRTVPAIALLLIFAVPAGGQRSSRDAAQTITHGGQERTYRVYVPPSYDGKKPVALVLVLHGGGGAGRSMIGLAKFNELADRHGFVVAYPDGLFRRWNDGRQSGAIESKRVDDVGFLSALMDQLGRDYRIDAKRVYSTGISNGGFMSQRLACDLADKIAAVAVVAATMGRNLSAQCKPARPVSVLLLHGTEDPLVPYEGGRVQVRGGGAILSAPAAVQRWVELDGCNGQPKKDALPDTAADETRTRREIYSGCREGSEVVFLAVEGGGHTWPGGAQYLPVRRIGRASRDFHASEVIWQFFSAHGRR
jgi:polyhydroxybutyrate depolymerase